MKGRSRSVPELASGGPSVRTGPSPQPAPPARPAGGSAESSGLLVATPAQLALKRGLDVVGAVLLIILLSPVLLAIAAAVVLTSPGDCLYFQERVGKHGRVFRMPKFRSMYVGAEARLAELETLNEVTGPVFKMRRDPRVTPVGRFLRRLSLDELPQLWNVLIGQMSLVGPRPPVPHECEQYTDREWRRLDVKPGLTCIWQVSGRSDVDFHTWVDMDLQYIREWTLLLDVRLLARTIPAVVSGRGAY